MVESGEVVEMLDGIDATENEARLTTEERARKLDPFNDHPQATAEALEVQADVRPEGMTLAEAPAGVIGG